MNNKADGDIWKKMTLTVDSQKRLGGKDRLRKKQERVNGSKGTLKKIKKVGRKGDN